MTAYCQSWCNSLSFDRSHYMVLKRNNIFIFEATVTKLQRWPKIWKFNFLSKPYSATYQMKGNFIRTNNMLLKKESDQTEFFFVKNEAKNYIFLTFFKMRSRDDFPLNSSWFVSLWPTQKCRKTQSDIILVTNLLSESSVLWFPAR